MSHMDQGAQPRLPFADDDRALRKRARRRIEALEGLYIHLFVFILVLAVLACINLMTGGAWWVLWVLLGWGIGVLAHVAAVIGGGSRALANWEKRKLEQLMAEYRG